MSIGTYPESKTIDEVVFRKTPAGGLRAYLHVKDGCDHDTLTKVVATLRDKGWQALPTSENDKPELEVRGFKTESQLIEKLQSNQWISGKGTFIQEPGDKVTFGDKFRKQTLFWSALSYFIGDTSFFTYGHKKASNWNKAAGVNYFLGTTGNFVFGSNPLIGRPDRSDLEIHDLSQKMADYMNQQDIKLPPEASINSIVDDHKKGFFQKTDDFLRHYPVEIMNSFYALAGICIAVAAYKQLHQPIDAKSVEQYVGKRLGAMRSQAPGVHIPEVDIQAMRERGSKLLSKLHHTTSWLDVGLGSLTFGSAMFGNFVKEKKRDPDEPAKTGLAGVWEWVQERPLTLTGAGYMVATMCHAASTAIDYSVGTSSAKEALFHRGTFVATNLIAELLIAISSKGHGHGVIADESINNSVISIAADTIAKQPANMQEDMINHVARFLGRPDTLALKDENVKSQLRHQVELMRKNPWAHASAACLEAEAKQNPVMPPVASVPATAEKPEVKAEPSSLWQAKIAAAANAEKHASPPQAAV